MKIVRWVAVVAGALMALMNLGLALEPDGSPAVAAAAAVVAGAGVAAAAGLALRRVWGRPVTVVVGAVNLVGAVVALARGTEGAVIGIVVSLVLLLAGLAVGAGARRAVAAGT